MNSFRLALKVLAGLFVASMGCQRDQSQGIARHDDSVRTAPTSAKQDRWRPLAIGTDKHGAEYLLQVSLRVLKRALVKESQDRVSTVTEALRLGSATSEDSRWALRAARMMVRDADGKFGPPDTASAEVFLDATRNVLEPDGMRDFWLQMRFQSLQALPWDSANAYTNALAHWRLNCASLAPTIVEFALSREGYADLRVLPVSAASREVSSPPPGSVGESALRDFCEHFLTN